MSSASLRIDGALQIAQDGSLVPVFIRIEAGQLKVVSAEQLVPLPGETVIDASGEIVTPGLINAHTHSPLAATRGTTDRMDHPTFMWTNQADTVGRSTEEIEAVTTLAAADMVRMGITGVVDHVPEQNADIDGLTPIFRAWANSKMRVAVALRVFDGRYDDIGDGGYSPAENPLKQQPRDVLLGVVEDAISKWHCPQDGMKVYPGPSNSERCSDALLAGAHALAERHDTGFHAHLLETEIQRTARLSTSGETAVSRLQRLGALSHRSSFAHCVWCDADDICKIAEAGSVVVHNPHSNAKLGVGLMPLPQMLSAGCRVALGTDGAATNDTLDLHETMALALLLQRVSGRVPRSDWPTARDALTMARDGGAAALLERGRLGVLRPGAHADLTFYNAQSATLSPANDLHQQLVFAERGHSVCRVMVAGRTLYEHGRWHRLDVEGAARVVAQMRDKR